MNLRSCLLAAAISLAVTAAAHAVPIAAGSSLDITGSDFSTTGVSIDLATGLNFTSVRTSVDPATITGSFAGRIAANLLGTIKSIPTFQPFAPILSFYSFTSGANTVTFDLNTVAVANRTASVNGSIPALTLVGTGMFNLTGFEATLASFTLTTQGSEVTTFSASTTSLATDVPEPATLALLGLGLAGLGLARRRKSA